VKQIDHVDGGVVSARGKAGAYVGSELVTANERRAHELDLEWAVLVMCLRVECADRLLPTEWGRADRIFEYRIVRKEADHAIEIV
jgi:hypothetical protein